MTEFETLFAETRGLVFGYLMRLSRNPSLAEELTQETFFRAYMNYAALRDKTKATAWLCRIARNAYFAWYHEQGRQTPLEEPPATVPSAEEAFEHGELSRRALACLQALGEPYGEVFSLAVLGGVSLKDISALYGKSESWARVTFYRAKQKLQEAMGE